MIGTPAYAGQVHVDYVHALMSFYRAGIRFSIFTIDKESLITRARNSIISQFHGATEFSHLLFLDGDIYIDGKDIQCLLNHEKDVIGVPVPLKGTDQQGRQLYNTGPTLRQENELIVTDRIGTAVLMLARSAVDALIADASERGDTYLQSADHFRGNAEKVRQYDVFRVGVVNGEYLSEDFWVCRRLRDLGFEIYADPSVAVRHHGPAVFGGPSP